MDSIVRPNKSKKPKMKEIDIVRQLSDLYGFDEREALILIGVDNNDVSEKSEYEFNIKTSSNNKSYEDVKAFDGIVRKDCCQAVIYNHGLYTQCPNICKNEFCSSQCKRKKYGHINVRKNFPAGTYVLEDGRREKKLDKIKSDLKKRESDKGNDKNDIELEREKQSRGRPKRNKSVDIRNDVEESDECDSDTEEIEVRKEVIDGKEYLVSRMNIVYDRETLKIIGRKRDGRLNLLEM